MRKPEHSFPCANCSLAYHHRTAQRIDAGAATQPPAGPLAVKQFHLEALPLKEGASPQRTPTFHMLRLGAQTHVMQWFELPEPMECAALRLCCTKNFLGDELPYAHSIGFWEISFK